MKNSSIRLKEKLSEMVKNYYWFISKGGSFDAACKKKPNQMSERKCQAVFLTERSGPWHSIVQSSVLTRKCIKLHRFTCIMFVHVLETHPNRYFNTFQNK